MNFFEQSWILRVVVSSAILLTVSCALAAEEVSFELGRMRFEPLIEFYPPPDVSGDKFLFADDGLRVFQFGDQDGKIPWTAGFRTQLMCSGDLKASLDLDLDIEEPLSGWGQGVALIVTFNDAKKTQIKLARYAVPNVGQIAQVEVSSPKIKSPIYLTMPNEVKSGTLIIERIGAEAIFSISNGSDAEELEKLPCPVADIGYIEVICTRQPEGNSNARYLLKRLDVSADRFFAFDTGRKSWFSWWWLALLAQAGILGTLLYWALKRQP